MTEGQRIAEEMDGAPRADTARRIDAALAEAVEKEREKWRWPAHDVGLCQATLAEREAQIAAQTTALVHALSFAEHTVDHFTECHEPAPGLAILQDHVRMLQQVLTSTADAAARCVARAKVEGAEEMRERCVEIALVQPYYPDTHTGMRQQWVKEQIAAAIRALDAGDPAARRG